MDHWAGRQSSENHWSWKERKKRNEDSLRDLWDNIKYINIHIIGVQKEERKKVADNILEYIIAENSPNMGKERDIED